MIISRTAYRISFVGGETDLPSFYTLDYGIIISTTIGTCVSPLAEALKTICT